MAFYRFGSCGFHGRTGAVIREIIWLDGRPLAIVETGAARNRLRPGGS